MKIVSFLQSVSYANKTGVFYTRKENATEWARINVNISPLLMWRIQHFEKERRLPQSKHYVGTYFSSYTDSKDYAENPFHLVRFVPKEGTVGTESFKLECVDEAHYKVADIITGKLTTYKNAFKKADYWVRETLIEFATDLDASRPMYVAPNLTFVPVA